jgi:ADP-heptose:LPS heptosyltransferase
MRALGALAPRSVVVLRALQLGDLLCAVPVLRALRAALPEAHISLVGLPWAQAFAARFRHYLDGFIPFPGYPGLPEREPDIHAFPKFLSTVQRCRFDLALQLQGSGIYTNPLTVLLSAKRCAGFYAEGEFCPDPDLFLPYPEAEPEIRRLLRLMEFLGAPSQGEALEFPLEPADHDELGRYVDAEVLHRPYACLHPGARSAAKRWPPACFAAVGDALSGCGLQIVLTGSEVEAPLTRAVAALMRAPAIDSAGPISIGGLAALLSRARLLVSNDTGVSHVAAALKVPSVILFIASDLARWSPSNRDLHRCVWDPEGVKVEEVARQALTLLRRRHACLASS